MTEEEEEEVTKKELSSDSIVYIREKKVHWLTKSIAENGPRDTFLHVTLSETVLFLIFLVMITTIAIGSVSPSMFLLTKILRDEFIHKNFETVNGKEIAFDDVKTPADFWAYLNHAVTQSFYWKYWYDNEEPIQEASAEDQNIIYENKLLGVPRLRQLKVRNDTCKIHETFQRSIEDCYGDLSKENEDKSNFGLEQGTAWVYSTLDDHDLFAKIFFNKYPTGGYYQDFSLNENMTIDLINELKENLWITRGTRIVFLDFTVYNGNLNFFCVIKLIFEYPSTGGVLPSSKFYTLKLIRYGSNWDYFIMGLELLFLCNIIYYTSEEIREIVYLKEIYFLKFWSYVDVTIITLGYICALLSIYRHILVENALNDLKENPEEHIDFEKAADVQVTFNNTFAVILFMIYMKLFKYITFNKMMSQLNNTIKNCATDIAGFSVMFFIIFIAFAELGYLIFGTQVGSFSSFGISMFTLLRTILGDFDYSEIEEVDRILAPFFFLSFIVLVFFVLLNMFLAIINDTYTDVKTELAVAPDEMQMQEYLKRGYYNVLKMCNCGVKAVPQKEMKNEFNLTIEEIRGALKKCGFSDLEIEMFFSKYNVDTSAPLGNYTINDLLKELETKPFAGTTIPASERRPLETTSDGTPLVSLEDFLEQQKKLDVIENKIEELVHQIKNVLTKLDSLGNVKKTPV